MAGGLLTGCSDRPSTADSSQKRPNILLISVDDMGYSDLGCYGSEINTPNIDQLARNGMRFRNFYNTAKCFPSRAALLTGVYAQDCGYHQTFTHPIRNAVTLGEVLRSTGYGTYWSGKHHGLENPYDRGFDRYYGLKDGAANHFNPGLQRPGEPAPARKRADRSWAIDDSVMNPYTPPQKDFYSTDYYTNYALQYLDESKEHDKPFFIYLAYTAPHDPLMAWPEDIRKYEGKYTAGYEEIRQARYEKQLAMGLLDESHTLSRPDFVPWDSLSTREQAYEARVMEVYAAMIDRLDQNIGRIMERLDSLNYTENTLILFVSDNGASREVVQLNDDDDNAPIGSMARWVSLGENWANVSNTPFRYYKNHSYEGGINTPLIASWPGHIAPHSFTSYPGHFIDVMATLVEVAGSSYPENFRGEVITPLRGESLVPVFTANDPSVNGRQNPLFWEWRGSQAMRLGNWKIVRNSRNTDWHLYDLENDPTEINDLSRENDAIIHRMDSMYHAWYTNYY